jgi:hypothetical protein
MTTIDGKTLADCFSLVAACGKELNYLRDTLANVLEERLREGEASLRCVLGSERIVCEYREDESTWVYTDMAVSFPLKASDKRTKRAAKYLGYQVSMTGDGIAIPGNKEPLLHVFCWSEPCNFRDGYYARFPQETDAEDPCVVVNGRLVMWGIQEATEWNKRSWCYSLRLTKLNTPEDVKKYVVDPAMALLKGCDVPTALPDIWLDKELIRYPAEGS